MPALQRESDPDSAPERPGLTLYVLTVPAPLYRD
jgi:hypothetical protein